MTTWSTAAVAALLRRAFAPAAAADDDARPAANIDVLITFDARGVSTHPNHVSLHHGARAFAAALGRPSPVDVYSLTTVGLARKYSSAADVFATLAACAAARSPRRLVFVSPLVGDGGLAAARRAMTDAHRSQMVWFRHLYILFSRYMVINDLRLERVDET